jgi:outer membrane protein assembly factor BamB
MEKKENAMSPRTHAIVLLAVLVFVAPALAQEKAPPKVQWPQFRGPGGGGIDPDQKPLPVQFGTGKGVAWKTPLPAGHSSPCIWGDRIFLTGFDDKRKTVETLCLDRGSGKILWRQAAPAKKIEKVQKISSPATGTPATDGERVYAYIASFGLRCYDFDGHLNWKVPLPFPKTRFGSGSSPIVAGDLVLVNADYLPRPYLLAVRGKTGEIAWKKERLPSLEGEGYATPFLWKLDGRTEVIVHTASKILAYNPKDGSEKWARAVKSTACSTPAAGDGLLFVSTWAAGGEVGEVPPLPSYAELLKMAGKKKGEKISKAEFPRDLYFLKRKDVSGDIPGAHVQMIVFFDLIDKNKDGYIDSFEWGVVQLFLSLKVEHGLLALRPGEPGKSAVDLAWKHKRAIPEVTSPLCYQGRVYLVREGGIVTCLDARTGKVTYQERLGAEGPYFASPIAGDGKIYVISYNGKVSVLSAGNKFNVLAQADLEDHVLATPAAVDGYLYVRTERHLFAFSGARPRSQ